MLEPIPYLGIEASTSKTNLTEDEVTQFKKNGFIVKPGLIQETQSFTKLVDYFWDSIPTEQPCRDLPNAWAESAHDGWSEEFHRTVGVLKRGIWKLRSPEKYGCEREILELTANHPRVISVVQKLIGSPVSQSHRVRGIYAVFPSLDPSEARLGPHVDHSAAHLSAMVIMDTINEGMGGFTVWPGSHLALHRFFQTTQGAHFQPKLMDEYKESFKKILNDTSPVEFIGNAGDVVFWHPRLIHSAGINRTGQSDTPAVRLAIPCDFQREGKTYFDDDDLGPSVHQQWWVNTRHFREDIPPQKNNLWSDWLFESTPNCVDKKTHVEE